MEMVEVGFRVLFLECRLLSADSDVGEVALKSQVVPLANLISRMFPEFPTETKVLSNPNRKLPSHLNPYLLKFHCSSLKCYLSAWNQYHR